MKRRHSWAKKIKGSMEVRKKIHRGYKIYKIKQISECVHCGLRKGIHTGGEHYMRWHNTIYFNQEREFLSEEKLPYACTGKQVDFLTKEDFYV
jgi:hypothetical protein